MTLSAVMARVRSIRSDQRGMTLIELVAAMAILGTVLAAATSLFVSGSRAETDLNYRFQAQQQARLALDTFRAEVHNACDVAVTGGTNAQLKALTLSGSSYVCTTVSSTWCTLGSGNRYALYRLAGAASTCTATGAVKWADYVTTSSGAIFSGPTQSSGLLPKLAIDLTVNLKPTVTRLRYELQDAIVLRNGARA